MEHWVNTRVGRELQFVSNYPYEFFNFIGTLVFAGKLLVGAFEHGLLLIRVEFKEH